MTFTEILDNLPNGLHDALLSSVHIDYLNRAVSLRLKICTGNPESDLAEDRESYRAADLRIEQFSNCIIESPGQACTTKQQEIMIDAGMFPHSGMKSPDQVFENTDPKDEQYWLFLNNLNSFIYVSAQRAELSWIKKDTQQEDPNRPAGAVD